MSKPDFSKVDAWVDAHFDDEVAFLQKLVQTPSDNPPGDCAPHAEVTAGLLEDLGFTVERHPVPDDVVKANAMISATNLIVRERFSDGPTIALNAHGDVVPPGDGWSVDPYGGVIRDGWLYGRGAAVSKSDFATYAFALKALKELGVPLKGTVELHLTYDEEIGGQVGPKWILDQGLSKPDFAICPAFSYTVTTAHNGCLQLEVIVQGVSAHAAMPESGHDALEAATKLLSALYEHRKSLSSIHSAVDGIDSPTLVVGLISGGINTNVVPDSVSLRLDRRLVPEEDPAKVEAELRKVIEQAVTGLPGIRVTINRLLLSRPFAQLPGSERLGDPLTRHASQIFGEDIKAIGVPIYTDARLYTEAGVPTAMYGAGPRTLLEANGHRADERVPLEELRKATKVIAMAIPDILDPA